MSPLEQRQFDYFSNLITSDLAIEIVKDCNKKMQPIVRDFPGLGTKLTSELFSKAFEVFGATRFSETLGEKVFNPTTDNDPDMRFEKTGYPLEVKVTAGVDFTGGAFSDRPSPHLLLARDKDDENRFFLAFALLRKNDWKKPGSKKRYGTTINKKKLLSLIKEGRAIVIFGNLREISLKKDGTPRKKPHILMAKESFKKL